jgi:hypothetical protein
MDFKQATPLRFSIAARPTKGVLGGSRYEGWRRTTEEEDEREVRKEQRRRRRHFPDWLCRRIRPAEERSAHLPADATPITNDARVGISDIRSQDREALLPLGISASRCGYKPDQN